MHEIKLDKQSLDIVNNNIQKLREIFPEIVLEDKIDFERLQDILGKYIERNEERYRFTWHGKSDAFRKSQTPSTGTLRPCIEESKNWDTTQNLYIEGDNLEVLKLLQKSYGGQVKMIYIDPPYNKDKDFVYSDKWSDPIKEYKRITGQIDDDGLATTSEEETQGGRHTNWLNMIYPRLRLARHLLKEDGVICIQIDDIELDNIKKVCDEIFGEENLINIICVKMSHLSGMKMSHKDKKLPKIKEYILFYARNKNNITLNNVYEKGNWQNVCERYTLFVEKTAEDYSKWKISKLSDKLSQFNLRTQNEIDKFCIEHASSIFRTAVNDTYAHMPKDSIFYYMITKKGLEKFIYNGEEVLFADSKLKIIDGNLSPAETIGDIWADIGINNLHNEGGVVFPNGKKPIKLILRLLKIFVDKNDIILDFFSGSATTAHAVMQLNAEDGGNRKFIMVQLPELIDKKDNKESWQFLHDSEKPENICEIGKERIRRAGEKIKLELKEKYDTYQKKQSTVADILEDSSEEKAPMNPDDLDIGFKVFKLDSSNLERWALDVGEDFYNLSAEKQHEIISSKLGTQVNNFVAEREDIDMLYEVMLKYGLDLSLPVETYTFNKKNVYCIGDGALFVSFADELDEAFADAIVAKVKELEPATVRVVVKDLAFMYDDRKTNFRETLKTGIAHYFAESGNTKKENQFEFITI